MPADATPPAPESLYRAIEVLDRPAAERALAQGAKINGVSSPIGLPLLGLLLRSPAQLQLALELGANPNLRFPFFHDQPDFTPPALTHAAWLGQADAVRLLLAHGANPNAVDPQGLTALFRASQANDLAAVKMLLGAGADPDLTSSVRETARLETPLSHALICGHTKIAAALIEGGARLDDESLRWAAQLSYRKYDADLQRAITQRPGGAAVLRLAGELNQAQAAHTPPPAAAGSIVARLLHAFRKPQGAAMPAPGAPR